MKRILTVVGARPQFIKAAPLSRALAKAGLGEILVHTGQHYDRGMSDVFFEELDIPAPSIHLGIGQASRAVQLARMIEGLSDAIDAVRVIGEAAGVDIDIVQSSRAALHPGRTGVLSVGHVEVGYIGELHPDVSAGADLPGRATVLELDLDGILALAGQRAVAASLSTFPAATQDVSLVVGADVPAGEIRATLSEGAGDLLESVRLVDDYRGDGLPEGSKSLTFALRFRADDRTLTAAEATEAKLAGVAVAAERFGATIRD